MVLPDGLRRVHPTFARQPYHAFSTGADSPRGGLIRLRWDISCCLIASSIVRASSGVISFPDACGLPCGAPGSRSSARSGACGGGCPPSPCCCSLLPHPLLELRLLPGGQLVVDLRVLVVRRDAHGALVRPERLVEEPDRPLQAARRLLGLGRRHQGDAAVVVRLRAQAGIGRTRRLREGGGGLGTLAGLQQGAAQIVEGGGRVQPFAGGLGGGFLESPGGLLVVPRREAREPFRQRPAGLGGRGRGGERRAGASQEAEREAARARLIGRRLPSPARRSPSSASRQRSSTAAPRNQGKRSS